MAQNPIPDTPSQVLALGNSMLAGLTSLGETLGITQVTPAQLSAALAAFSAQDSSYNAARTARKVASDEVGSTARTLKGWLAAVKGVLSSSFGYTWNADWVQAGFTDSTAIPTNVDDQVG